MPSNPLSVKMDNVRVEAVVEVRFKTFKYRQPGPGMNASSDQVVVRYSDEAIVHLFKVREKNIFGDLPVSAQDGVDVQVPLVPRAGALTIGISPIYLRFIVHHGILLILTGRSLPLLIGSSPAARRSTPEAEETDRGVG
jgi:hypothetical protein